MAIPLYQERGMGFHPVFSIHTSLPEESKSYTESVLLNPVLGSVDKIFDEQRIEKKIKKMVA